jgi:hypothetical protein
VWTASCSDHFTSEERVPIFRLQKPRRATEPAWTLCSWEKSLAPAGGWTHSPAHSLLLYQKSYLGSTAVTVLRTTLLPSHMLFKILTILSTVYWTLQLELLGFWTLEPTWWAQCSLTPVLKELCLKIRNQLQFKCDLKQNTFWNLTFASM